MSALTSIGAPVPYGRLWFSDTITSLLLDASGERVAFAFRAPATGTIRKVHFLLGTVTTWANLTCSLQDYDLTTGDPDGVADQSISVTGVDADDNTWKTADFGAGTGRAVTKNDRVFFVAELAGAGSLNIVAGVNPDNGFCQVRHFTASWADQGRAPIAVIEYSDGSIYPIHGMLPGLPTSITAGFASNSTPDERGSRFQVPVGCKFIGWTFQLRITANFELRLYDSDGTTVLTSITIDADDALNTSDGPYTILSDTEITLSANTQYRVTILPTTTSTARIFKLTASLAAHLAQMYAGTNLIATERTDAGAWTDTDTARYGIVPLLSQFHDGAGAGSGRPPFYNF
jgi:hypothetical protein